MTTRRTMTTMLNARVTDEQYEWLRELSDREGVTLSAATRRAVDDARLLEAARESYRNPSLEAPDTPVWRVVLGSDMRGVDDLVDDDQPPF